MDGDGRPYAEILAQRGIDQEMAELMRHDPNDNGKLVRSANNFNPGKPPADPLDDLKERFPVQSGESDDEYLARVYAPGGPAGAAPTGKPRTAKK